MKKDLHPANGYKVWKKEKDNIIRDSNTLIRINISVVMDFAFFFMHPKILMPVFLSNEILLQS